MNMLANQYVALFYALASGKGIRAYTESIINYPNTILFNHSR